MFPTTFSVRVFYAGILLGLLSSSARCQSDIDNLLKKLESKKLDSMRIDYSSFVTQGKENRGPHQTDLERKHENILFCKEDKIRIFSVNLQEFKGEKTQYRTKKYWRFPQNERHRLGMIRQGRLNTDRDQNDAQTKLYLTEPKCSTKPESSSTKPESSSC
jgi:hypothetical protein